MKEIRHGLSVGILKVNDEFYLELKVSGKLTHEDYKVISPMLDSAVKEAKQPKIKALVDLLDFEGWEIRAAWDDFKLGLAHGSEFTHIAIIGNKPWEKIAASVGSWFISGEVKYFEDRQLALDWLNSM